MDRFRNSIKAKLFSNTVNYPVTAKVVRREPLWRTGRSDIGEAAAVTAEMRKGVGQLPQGFLRKSSGGEMQSAGK